MPLTKKSRDRISKELWGDLAESGELKEDWPKWKKYGQMLSDCPFCEYEISHHQVGCSGCPIRKVYGGCSRTYWSDWCVAKTTEDRKEFARLFLEQLEAL